MRGPPTRQTRAAVGRRRWTGTAAKEEKDGYGVFLDDLGYAFAEISFLSLPVLFLVMMRGERSFFGVKASLFVAWMVAVVMAALVRGGWVTPLATDVPGWVSLKPSLVALRLLYYNALLAGVAIVGGMLASLEYPLLSVLVPAAVGAAAIAAFPAMADRTYGVVGAVR